MVPVAADPIPDGAVAVRDGVIAGVGPAAEVAATFADLAERDLGEAVLAPGFVDAHCHLEWSLMGGRAGPSSFERWLAGFLADRPRDPEVLALAAEFGALACLMAGTTAVADSGPTGAGVRALRRVGIRGVVHLEVFGDPDLPRAREAATATAERLRTLDDAAAGTRIGVGLAPHAPYTVGPDLWAALAGQPELAGRHWTTHLAESPAERAWIRGDRAPLASAYAATGVGSARPPGRPPMGAGGEIARLARAGALPPGLIAAHCVQADEDDAASLAAAGVRVAHCPSANVRLRCGRMPIELLRAAGVALALGTDSPGSGGSYDVRAEARACQALHAAHDAAPPDRELVEMMTRGGAGALRLAGVTGEIRAGAAADLVALRPVAHVGAGDPHALILDGASAVSEVIVGGRELVSAGRPVHLDVDDLRDRVVQARADLC